MFDRELIKTQIDLLPEFAVKRIIEFINYQKFLLGTYANDTEYLQSISGMEQSIVDGINTPLSQCSREIE